MFNRQFRVINRSTLLVLLMVFTQNSVFASKSIEQAGDALQILVPSVAYATTLYLNDKKGQAQFYKAFATNLAITFGLKNSVAKKRPNGGIHSFPSGHTSAAFQGAAFIHKRYGLQYSIPAYLAAGFVGYSRVESKYHFNEDVIAGAAIGIISSFYFTTSFHNISIRPLLKNRTITVQLSMML